MKKIKILSIIILILLNVSLVSSFVIHDTIYEGETKVYKTDEKTYEVKLITVSDTAQTARFQINNEITDELAEDKAYKFSDDSEIHIMWIWTNEALEGKDSVEFYFYGKGTKPTIVKEDKPEIEEVITPIEDKITTIEEEEKIIEEPKEEIMPEPEEKIIKEEKKSLFALIIEFFKKLFKL